MVENTLPPQVVYWLSAETKHDCFFVVGPESGQTERIGAFKTLLAGHSEPLRNMLEDSEAREQGDIRIIDTEPKIFKLFLKCVYSGHCDPLINNLTLEDSVSLLYIVEKYLVSTIKEKLISHMVKQLPADSETLDNFFIVLSNQVCLQVQKLIAAVLKVVQYKSDLFFSHEQFLQLSAESLLVVLKASSLNTSEGNVWKAVLKWAQHKSNSNDGQVLRGHILKHLKFIRFRAMSADEFCKNVVVTDILTYDEVIAICKSLGDPELSLNMTHICNETSPRPRLKPQVVSTLFKSTSTFSYKISNISQLEGDHYCDVFKFSNFSWYINVTKRDKEMAMYLYCQGNSTTIWVCSAAFEFTLVNQQNQINHTEARLSHTFVSSRNEGWGFGNFYNWSDLLDTTKGFVKDNSIIVMVNMISVTAN